MNKRYEHQAWKAALGQAAPGTTRYARNAVQILSVHAGEGARSETVAKLGALTRHSDHVVRTIARDALKKSI